MGNFSTRQDVYINQFSNPKVQELSKTISFRAIVVPGEDKLTFAHETDPFAGMVSPNDEGQQVVLLGIYLLFVNNETKHDVYVDVRGLFQGKRTNQDVPHVDDNGELRILCPASFNNVVLGTDRILYKPRLKDDILRMYAGMERAIVECPKQPVLDATHPMMHFILHSGHLLNPTSVDVYKNETSQTYTVDPVFLERVRTFFTHTIYDDMHPTRLEGVSVSGKIPRALSDDVQLKKNAVKLPNVTLIVQINYLLVTPGENKMRHMELKV